MNLLKKIIEFISGTTTVNDSQRDGSKSMKTNNLTDTDSSSIEAKEKIVENVLKTCKEEYNDKLGAFNGLDTKGQYVIAFSGTLLGILISFCKEETLNYFYGISPFCIFLIIATVFLLMFTICVSFISMKITNVPGAPTYEGIKPEFLNLVGLEETTIDKENYINFIYTQILIWERAFGPIQTINIRKGKYISIAQVSCAIALILLGVVGLIVLFSPQDSCTCRCH